MDIIIHRVNDLLKLSKVSSKYGVEVDVMYDNNKLILKHSPYEQNQNYIELEKFLKFYKHKKLILNIKTSGIEEEVIETVKNYTNDFLLLDVEFPFIVKNYKKFGKNIFLRVSKYESFEHLLDFKNFIEWIWLDTYDNLKFDEDFKDLLKNFKICLVSIERWFPKYDFEKFSSEIKFLNIPIDAVLTDLNTSKKWEEINLM